MEKSALEIYKSIDAAIVDFENSQISINKKYGDRPSGRLMEERNSMVTAAKDSLKEHLQQLKIADAYCKSIRVHQPLLSNLTEDFINTKSEIPDNIALGLYSFKSKYFYRKENGNDVDEIVIPHLYPFPILKPMYVDDEKTQAHFFQKILLRLMFTLPMDRQEYYIYDPVGLGDIVMNFNILLKNEKLFPQKKVLTTQADLKDALKKVKEYINSLNESAFNAAENIVDWSSYNRHVLNDSNDENKKKLLPYKVFVFADISSEMDQECFDMIKVIINQSAKCGLLVLFSYNAEMLHSEDRVYSRRRLEVQRIVDDSVALHKMIDEQEEIKGFRNIEVKPVGESFPSSKKLGECLRALDTVVAEHSKSMFAFDE